MNVSEWKQTIGQMVRENMQTEQADRYYNIKVNQLRAQTLLTQLALFVRHRRDCWAYASGNCPELAVKKRFWSMNTVRLLGMNTQNSVISIS
jgi:hypothetical protein